MNSKTKDADRCHFYVPNQIVMFSYCIAIPKDLFKRIILLLPFEASICSLFKKMQSIFHNNVMNIFYRTSIKNSLKFAS